jgi:hypothetical protein
VAAKRSKTEQNANHLDTVFIRLRTDWAWKGRSQKEEGKNPYGLCRDREMPVGTRGSPFGAVFHHPVNEGVLETDVVSGFLTLKPFVAEDFGSFLKILPIER